ncbi:MAG: hypothetical protein EXS63_06030 [Candidatus Omnitrophica bacterium]|nr:hypothetical protein [Candidatus Omnitrophota bacterium]
MQYFAYSQKAFVYKYVVMLSDIDQFQHMSFANYTKLMFLAADALFVSCLDQNFLCKKRLRLINARMQFKRQTIAGDHILIKLNTAGLTETQFSLLHTFVIEGSGELVGLGRQTYELTPLMERHPERIFDTPGIKNVLESIVVKEETLLYQY